MWGHPGQEAAVHGRRVRPAARMDSRRRARMVGRLASRARRHAAVGERPEPACTAASPRSTGVDFSPDGFEWLDADNADASVIAFLRKGGGEAPPVLVVCNFTPLPRTNFLVGVPKRGLWREILNSDARDYGGAGWGNLGAVESVPVGQSRPRRVGESQPAAPLHPHAAVGTRWLSGRTPRRGDGRIRAVIDSVSPSVDGGRFPAKRIAGEPVRSRPTASPMGTTSCASGLSWNARCNPESSIDEIGHGRPGQRCLDAPNSPRRRRAAIDAR